MIISEVVRVAATRSLRLPVLTLRGYTLKSSL